MARTIRGDLGPGDVHIDGPVRVVRRPAKKAPMAKINTEKRNVLPAEQFALPATRQYPIHDAAHVRNAAARLEQNKGSLTKAQYDEAKRNIARAAKKFGVESQYNKPAQKKAVDPKALQPARKVTRRGLHLQIGLAPDGGHRIEVMHASAHIGGVCMRGGGMAIATPRSAAAEIKRLSDIDSLLKNEQTEGARATLLAEADELRALVADANKPVWNQLAKVGVFKGHSAGPFELNHEVFDQIVRNFDATVNHRIPVDFEHASEEEASNGTIPVDGAPAQGWIIKLENRGAAGLWGLIEWLEPARTYIREGKYKFFSPAIRFGAKDRVTGQPIGARMTSGALTNNPFLDGLMPVAAKDAAGDRMSTTHTLDASDKHMMAPGAFFPKLKEILKLHPLASATECKDHIDKLRDLCGMADHPNQVVHGVNLGEYLHPLKAMMNMAEHEATPAQILDAVEEMIEAALAIHEVTEHGAGPMETNELTMTAQDLAVKLGETKSKLEVLTAQKNTVDTELAVTATKLKDAEGKLTDALTRAAKAEADIVALKAENTAREERELQARVDTAFATYKDAKKLSDKDRAQMLIVAKADPKLFDDCYPLVPPGKEHLLRNITNERAAITGPQGRPGGFSVTPGGVRMNDQRPRAVDEPTNQGRQMSEEDMTLLSDKLRAKGYTHEASIKEAYAIARGLKPMPADLASN